MTLSEEKVMDIIKESNISLLSVAYSTRSVETVSIQRLPVFLSAAEHLNFTRAAEEQCISQTAVSQQIKLLEQELGYALFVRGKRGVRLTLAGEVFYRQCRSCSSAITTPRRRAERPRSARRRICASVMPGRMSCGRSLRRSASITGCIRRRRSRFSSAATGVSSQRWPRDGWTWPCSPASALCSMPSSPAASRVQTRAWS